MDQERRPPRKTPTSFYCLVCYFMATISVSFAVLPREALAVFGGRPEGGSRFFLGFAGVLFALGLILHVTFLRLDPDRFDRSTFRRTGSMMGLILGLMFGLSFASSRATGLPDADLSTRMDRLIYWVGTGGIGLIVASVAILYITIQFHPANRMSRRLFADDADGAIRIGESIPPVKRGFGIRANLVTAYVMAGRVEQARSLLTELESAGWDPSIGPEDQYRIMMDHLRGRAAGALATPLGGDDQSRA